MENEKPSCLVKIKNLVVRVSIKIGRILTCNKITSNCCEIKNYDNHTETHIDNHIETHNSHHTDTSYTPELVERLKRLEILIIDNNILDERRRTSKTIDEEISSVERGIRLFSNKTFKKGQEPRRAIRQWNSR